MSPRRRLLVLALPAIVPWTVQVLPGELFFVFPWGLGSTRSLDVVFLTTYLFERTAGVAGLPSRTLAWPIASVVYACALGVALVGSIHWRRSADSPGSRGRDRRVPSFDPARWVAILLALAALAHLRVTLGLLALGVLAVPTGPAVLLGAAWWVAG